MFVTLATFERRKFSMLVPLFHAISDFDFNESLCSYFSFVFVYLTVISTNALAKVLFDFFAFFYFFATISAKEGRNISSLKWL